MTRGHFDMRGGLIRILTAALYLIAAPVFGAAASSEDSGGVDAFVAAYDSMKDKVTATAASIRDSRKAGATVDSGEVLLVRKEIYDLVKQVRKYDKVHAIAARRTRAPYPERERLLRLLHACDAMHRVLEAEMKANDFAALARKYEDDWKQADAGLLNDSTQADQPSP